MQAHKGRGKSLAPLAGKGNSLQTTDTTSQTLCFTLSALQLYSAHIALTETRSRDLTLFIKVL